MEKIDKFEILGGKKLNGTVRVQTAKNSVLPIMAATILCEGNVVLNDIPNLTDIANMSKKLTDLGAKIKIRTSELCIDTDSLIGQTVDQGLAKSMRSSIFLLGSLLARFHTARLTMPGGCKIGKRPIDAHLKSFQALGVEVNEINGEIFLSSSKAHAGKVKLSIPSVGATENIVMFACKLKGKTVIKNCACEPEIVDLCNFLNLAGAKILGAGTKKITIYGVDKLKGVNYTPIPDRVVTATIMTAVAVCGGNVTLTNTRADHIENLIEKLSSMGCQISIKNDIINISSTSRLNSIRKIKTGFYPKFATDMQSILLVASVKACGDTEIHETIFENRFLIVPELNRMGADIEVVSSSRVRVRSVDHLKANTVRAMDLRGGAALVLAGLMTEGKTVVEGVHYIDRGYDHLENILGKLGADIKRV